MPLRTSLTVWILSAALFFCGAAVLYGIPRPKAPPPGQAGVWSEAQRPSDPPRRSAVPPGTFAWRTLKAVAAPVVGNVIIYDYGTVACIVNPGAADIPEPVLPDQQPDWVILVEQPVDSVWWDPQRRQLRRRIGCLDRVTCYPDYDVEPHPVAVPYHSCSIGKADMHSSGYEGCTAVVLFNGETCAYAH